MIQKIKMLLLAVILPFTFAVPVLVPVSASAVCSNIASNVGKGADSAAGGGGSGGCNSNGLSDSSVQSIGAKIVTIFSEVVGVISIIMIIYGGFRYITSGGDSGNVGNAKNTIIYALVGLIIVALSQALVHYVLNASSTVVK